MTTFNNTGTGRIGTVQEFTAPVSAYYRITAAGAQGGKWVENGDGGLGAVISLNYFLNAGDKLNIVVGQQGTAIPVNPENYKGSTGGGSTIVVHRPQFQPLKILYHQRSASLEAHDTALIGFLESEGHVVTPDPSDLSARNLADFDVLMVGSASNHPFSESAGDAVIKESTIPVLSFCRWTVRNSSPFITTNSTAQAGVTGASRQKEISLVDFSQESVSFDPQVNQGVGFSAESHLVANHVIYRTTTSNASDQCVAFYLGVNTPSWVHFGLFEANKWNADLQDLFRKSLSLFREATIVVSGGGGGSGVGNATDNNHVGNASLLTSGKAGASGNVSRAGGTDGLGGLAGNNTRAGAGAGFLTNGENPSSNLIAGGRSFVNFSTGGDSEDWPEDGVGGYGGGGGYVVGTIWGACGGGGGFSGGGIGYSPNATGEGVGGGGGSFAHGVDVFAEDPLRFVYKPGFEVAQFEAEVSREGHGYVEIQQLGYLAGIVQDETSTPQEGWPVRVYDWETGKHLGESVSGELGVWRWEGGTPGVKHYVVAVDPGEVADDFIPAAANRVIPEIQT